MLRFHTAGGLAFMELIIPRLHTHSSWLPHPHILLTFLRHWWRPHCLIFWQRLSHSNSWPHPTDFFLLPQRHTFSTIAIHEPHPPTWQGRIHLWTPHNSNCNNITKKTNCVWYKSLNKTLNNLFNNYYDLWLTNYYDLWLTNWLTKYDLQYLWLAKILYFLE